MLETYNHFFRSNCNKKKFEKLELDTEYLCLALAEENLDDCNLPEKKPPGLRPNNCKDVITKKLSPAYLLRVQAARHARLHNKRDKRKPEIFKEELLCFNALPMQQDVLLL